MNSLPPEASPSTADPAGTSGPDDEASAAPPQPGRLGRLAKLLRSRTTDLVAIGILSVALLAMGRTVTRWWATSPDEVMETVQSPSGSEALLGWNDPNVPVDVRFADVDLGMIRERVVGERKDAWQRLHRRCVEVTRAAAFPEGTADEAERRLLKVTEELPPAEQESGKWATYFVPLPVGMVVGVREPPRAGVSAPPRVVCWGMVLRGGEEAWTVYLFQRDRAAGLPVASMELPPGAERTLSVGGGNGTGLVGFDLPAPADAWTSQADAFWTERGWERESGWRKQAGGWFARYGRCCDDPRRAAVQLVPRDGGFRGLVTITSQTTAGEHENADDSGGDGS